ncbi:hypothetical protein CCACVL1_03553 [Corchorus capsularis]|uniref:Retrovirus-related Pol polyprotein from transposon TNT 1-94-like beta-barrel domain-containing protein n=1 Tax=Corchorus capsularis TaxID=210143 RepID=A0A1R3JYK2_COCAP|nr:hypothetical protein CCACVL1_03553 [Corchorus capsularis]
MGAVQVVERLWVPELSLERYGIRHIAKECYKIRPKQNQVSANVATSSSKPSNSWLLDIGALHHVTSDLRNLELTERYGGTDELVIGDGSGLSISHTGSTSIPTKNSSFILNDVLCVPRANKNLCSVSKFCKTNNVSVEFSHFLILLRICPRGEHLQEAGVMEASRSSTLPGQSLIAMPLLM